MPLLRRKPFIRKKAPRDLYDDEEVFYCELTDEIFVEYEEFCERIIQCNSLVWSCAVTGKTDLTYQEALTSEEEARQSLRDFPVELRIPVLYLASLTQRTSFRDLAEDVFMYMRDRYFVGETVEVSLEDNVWYDCHVLQVVAPLEQDILNYRLSANVEHRNSERYLSFPAPLYRYEVELLENCDEDVSEVYLVPASQVRRKKGVYSKERNRQYLKQYAEMNPKGVWVIGVNTLLKYGIPRVKFQTLFVGKPPVFQTSKKVKQVIKNLTKQNHKKQNYDVKREKRQENIQKYFLSPGKQEKSPKKKSPTKVSSEAQQLSPKRTPKKVHSDLLHSSPQKQMAKKVKDKYKGVGNMRKAHMTKKLIENHKMKTAHKFKHAYHKLPEEMKQKIREEKKERALEEKRKRLEERLKEKAKRKEEKMKLAQFMKEWNRQREDLECEDLKDLPAPTQVKCLIPNEYFGDFVMVLEFLHSFSDVLSSKTFFPNGVTFELIERALSEKEVAGPLSDIIQLLLTAVFNMQDEEDDEVLETDAQTAADLDVYELGDVTSSEAIRLATGAASWSSLYQGMALSKLTLDSVTLTEILRLHLLSSGGRSGEMSAKWRYQQRGGYTSHDDPGLVLRIHQPHILRALSVMNVCELSLGDKLKILTCLINQILTYTTVRDVIDDRGDKMRQGKAELRGFQVAELKREKEAAAIRLKEKKEAKLKLKGGQQGVVVESDVGNEEDKEAHKLKLEKESVRRKQEAQKKTKELHFTAMGHQVLPLGTDRAHRRFWMFASLPGLFVEHDYQWAGPCLAEPTPHDPALARVDDTLSYVRKLFEEGGSDKENDVGDADLSRPVTSPNKKMLAEKNISNDRTTVSDRSVWSESKVDVNSEEDKVIMQFLACTADDNCPIHSLSAPRTTWAFFAKEDDVNTLIKCLNRRGIRESELRQILLQEQQRIMESISRCPVHKLDENQVQVTEVPEQRKSSRNAPMYRIEDTHLNFPVGTPVVEILELTLRDCILEMEEKIHMGGLGSLKVYDRELWRDLLGNKKYDRQCDVLRYGGKAHYKEQKDSPNNIPVEKIKIEDSGTRPGTPDSEISYKDPGRLLGGDVLISQQESLNQHPVVKSLASAILQVAQSVEVRYLGKPLGSDDAVVGENTLTQLERWEVSLMASTSFSQLFLHLSTLEYSIQWSKSALNAHCRLCRRRGDAENMLLCDGCNKGHHMYCLKPKLTNVPRGDWFCPACRPQNKIRSAKKSRRLFSEESDEDVPLKKESNKVFVHDDACDSCGIGGELVCCSSCPLAFHGECIVPPLRKLPRGKWFCLKCRSIKEARTYKDGVFESMERVPLRQRRCCATAAVTKISRFAKRLRSHSWDDDDSEPSEEVAPSRRSSRRSLEVDLDLPLNNAVLQDLLSEIMHHKDAWPFLRPVPRAQVPDYHLIIKRPMDFGTMKYKLNMIEYMNNSEFIADALLVFENCQMYNQMDAQEYKAGVRLSRYFEKRCRELGLQFKEHELRQPEAKRPRLSI